MKNNDNSSSNNNDIIIQRLLLNPQENPLLLIDWAVALDEKRQQEQEEHRLLFLLFRPFRFKSNNRTSREDNHNSPDASSSSSCSLLMEPLEQGRLHGNAGRAQFRKALEYLLSKQQQQQQQKYPSRSAATAETAPTTTTPTTTTAATKVSVTSSTTSSPSRAKSTTAATTNNINKAITPIIVSGLLTILQEQQQLEKEESAATSSSSSGLQKHPDTTTRKNIHANIDTSSISSPTSSASTTTELVWYCHRARHAAMTRIRRRHQVKIFMVTTNLILCCLIFMTVTIRAIQLRSKWMQTWQMVVPIQPQQQQHHYHNSSSSSSSSSNKAYSCQDLPLLYQTSCRFMEARLWYMYRNSPISRLLLHPGDDDDFSNSMLRMMPNNNTSSSSSSSPLHQVDSYSFPHGAEAFALSTPWSRPSLIRRSEVLLENGNDNNDDDEDHSVNNSVLYSFISEQLHKLQNGTTSSRSSSSSNSNSSMDMLDVGCGIGAWLYHYLQTTMTSKNVESSSTSTNAENAISSSSWSYHGIAASHAQVNLARRLWKYYTLSNNRGWGNHHHHVDKGTFSSSLQPPPPPPPPQVSFEQPQFPDDFNSNNKSNNGLQLAVPYEQNRYSLVVALGDEMSSTTFLQHLVAALRRRDDDDVKNNNNNATASRLVLVQEYLIRPRRAPTTSASTSARQEQLFTYSQWKVAIRQTGCNVDFIQDLTFQFELMGRPQGRSSSSRSSSQSMNGFGPNKKSSLPWRLLSSLWELWVSMCTAVYGMLTGNVPARRWTQLYFSDQGMVQQQLQRQVQRYQRPVSSSSSSEPVTSHFIVICHV